MIRFSIKGMKGRRLSKDTQDIHTHARTRADTHRDTHTHTHMHANTCTHAHTLEHAYRNLCTNIDYICVN